MLRPIQHLPIKPPSEYDPSEEDPDYFYNNFVKHFINDMNRMMCTGLNIDSKAVEELRSTIDNVLAKVDSELSNNPIIERFQEYRYPKIFEEYKTKVLASIRDVDYYYRDYKPTDLTHRSYLVNYYLKEVGREHCCKDKWTVKALKQFNLYHEDKFIVAILDKDLTTTRARAKGAMLQLAKDKVAIWNLVRTNKVDEGIEVPPFNPASSHNKKDLFAMLGIESPSTSKTSGEQSWGRDSIEYVLKTTEDEDLKKVLNALIDHSFSAIITNTFLKAFDSYVIDGVLHGNVRLGGAKTWRNTSNSPSLLNMPASISRFAKPLKSCFIAPEEMIVAGIDLDQLEERILVNVTKDKAKLDIFTNGYDSHMYNCIHYGYEELKGCKEEFYSSNNKKDYLLKLKKEYSKVRSKSKSITFLLNYLGHPNEHKGGMVTQEIYDSYHELYLGVRQYRENIMMPEVLKKGYLHMGLGARLYSANVEDDVRTLHNACFQFYSIITLLAINELNYQIDLAGYTNKIQVTSTIYDSIYLNVVKDPKVIKWLNDTLVQIITTPIFQNELIKNEANMAIASNWADLDSNELPNNCSEEYINKMLEEC